MARLFVIGTLALGLLMVVLSPLASSAAAAQTNILGTLLGLQDFKFIASCLFSTQFPTYVNGNFVLPYPGDNLACPQNIITALAVTPQKVGGFSFTGIFRINARAPVQADEEAVFVSDDIVKWASQAYGFRASLNDGTIYGFVQDGAYWNSMPLMHDDNKTHNFSVVESASGDNSTFYFYVDNVLRGIIRHASSVDFPAQSYWTVMTTQRWSGGWISHYSYLSVRDIRLYGLPAASSSTSSTTSTIRTTTSTTTSTVSTTTVPTTASTTVSTTTVDPPTTVPTTMSSTTTIPQQTSGALTSSQFSAFSSCGATPPVIMSPTEFVLHVPANYGCSILNPDYSHLQSIKPTSSPIVSYQFDAKFVGVGNSTALYEYKDEEVVTLVNNVQNYQGQEFGMHVAMNSGTLYGYLQNGPGPTPIVALLKPGSGNVFNYSGHFKVTVQYVNGADVITYYRNGIKLGGIDYPSSQDYTKYAYYVLITTHRWENGWGSGTDSLTVSNFTITTV